jgi:hypothetical protein
MTIANGGTIVYTDIDGLNPSPAPTINSCYKVHIFNSSANLEVEGAGTLEYLIIGGGGAGGHGGGGGANTSIDYHVHAGGSGTVGQGNNGGSTPGYSGSALYAAMAVTDDIYKPSFSIDYIHIGYTPSPTTETTVAMAFNEVAFGVLTNVNVSVNS